MRNIIAILLILALSACSSSRGFDRGELRDKITDRKVVTEDDIRKAIESRPQLPSPFKLAIYFAPPKSDYRYNSTSWNWVSEDKEKLLEIGPALKSKNLISEAIIIGDSILEGTDNKAIRLAAARAGADAVLIVNAVSATDRYNNTLGATYFLIITPFFVPGTVIDSLFMVNASMWDVRNQYLYLSTEAEGTATETRPAFLAEEKRVIKNAKGNAIEAISKELTVRLTGMGAK